MVFQHGEHGFDFPLQGPDHKGLCGCSPPRPPHSPVSGRSPDRWRLGKSRWCPSAGALSACTAQNRSRPAGWCPAALNQIPAGGWRRRRFWHLGQKSRRSRLWSGCGQHLIQNLSSSTIKICSIFSLPLLLQMSITGKCPRIVTRDKYIYHFTAFYVYCNFIKERTAVSSNCCPCGLL